MHSLLPFMLAGALLGTGLAIAQSSIEEPQNKSPRYLASFNEQLRSADLDGDGALSKTEAEAAKMGRLLEHFDKLDTNKDGKLTRDEIRALVRMRLSS
ncbi:MAG TPA: hypothetical protein VJ603_09605 [Paucimonas sp.]|nr:hypothetical protein [Paucimonas sp.]